MKATVLKLYPSPPQKKLIEQQLGSARYTYNHFLAIKKIQYRLKILQNPKYFCKAEKANDSEKRKNLSAFDMNKILTQLKKKKTFLTEAYSTCLTQLDFVHHSYFSRWQTA